MEFDCPESAARALEAYGVPANVEGETKEELAKKDPGEMLTSIKSYVKEHGEMEKKNECGQLAADSDSLKTPTTTGKQRPTKIIMCKIFFDN